MAITPSFLLGSSQIVFKSGAHQTSLLEVYSSEGCSSCPPAERWLDGLKTDPNLWTKFVPICFHVDYWDYLGWKDPLSSRTYSERQRAYANHWNSESVYTPGFVLNGLEWKGWYKGNQMSPSSSKAVGVLTVQMVSTAEIKIEFSPVDGNGEGWKANVAFLGMEITSNVLAGENRGKTLRHNFAVLDLKTIPLNKKDKIVAGVLKFSSPNTTAKRAIAVWITKQNDPTPVQAIGGYLTAEKK